jgi:hypothetical protein
MGELYSTICDGMDTFLETSHKIAKSNHWLQHLQSVLFRQ